MQQKKTFDPRHKGMTNPFVQSYLEKQAEKSKPLSERQKLINLLLVCGMVLNLAVLGIVAYATHQKSAEVVTSSITADADQALSMGEAMERIRSLDASVQTMRSTVEFHKNAYFKLEQDHESLKAVLAQVVPAGNEQEMKSGYMRNSLALQTLPNPQLDSPQALEAARQAQAVQAQNAPDLVGLEGSASGSRPVTQTFSQFGLKQ